jgi:hypothetical protein
MAQDIFKLTSQESLRNLAFKSSRHESGVFEHFQDKKDITEETMPVKRYAKFLTYNLCFFIASAWLVLKWRVNQTRGKQNGLAAVFAFALDQTCWINFCTAFNL